MTSAARSLLEAVNHFLSLCSRAEAGEKECQQAIADLKVGAHEQVHVHVYVQVLLCAVMCVVWLAYNPLVWQARPFEGTGLPD